MTFKMPADQNHHFTLSFMAMAKLALRFPSISRHFFSRTALLPRKVHQTVLQPGLTFPAAKRALYSSACFRRLSKDAVIRSAMDAAPLLSGSLYKSDASSGRAYPRPSRPVIHPKVTRANQEAVISGSISASSMDALGGGGGLVDVNGTLVYLHKTNHLVYFRQKNRLMAYHDRWLNGGVGGTTCTLSAFSVVEGLPAFVDPASDAVDPANSDFSMVDEGKGSLGPDKELTMGTSALMVLGILSVCSESDACRRDVINMTRAKDKIR